MTHFFIFIASLFGATSYTYYNHESELYCPVVEYEMSAMECDSKIISIDGMSDTEFINYVVRCMEQPNPHYLL
jgi:hypothetical protein